MSDIPSSFPPPRPPRPRVPLEAPPRGAKGASLGASRLPKRVADLSTARVGGSGSRSESRSGSLPIVYR